MVRATVRSLCIVAAAVALPPEARALSRDADPVVLAGADVPSLVGQAPSQVVAFQYEGGWVQIPVQIDERKIVDFGVVYDDSPIGVTTLAYADANTYCGADPDPTFDADDELVFMAKDAGERPGPGAGEPSGVVAGSGVEVEVTDPLDSSIGYVYLFVTDGTLSPDAGQDYVAYTFDLLRGTYIPNYKTSKGPNPEDSEAVSAYYRTHFSDRWIRDELNVYAGGSTGVDILDRHKNLFYVGYCGRSEDTFSNAEGAFFVNKDGPVRALRSYMGANSGPLTQRVHRFYERRQDVTTHLRVHEIPSIMDLYDYSPAAAGMTYYNDLNLGGVTVDGVPDSVATGQITWEMVTGVQGSVLISHEFATDMSPDTYWSHYSDDSTPSATQCTGDAYEYGLSGAWVNHGIPNTDPRTTPYYSLMHLRVMRYDAPGRTTADGTLHHEQVSHPMTVAIGPYEATCVLALTVINDLWGSVDIDPEPNDANAPVYPAGTPVALTAAPNTDRSFNRWLIFDPNYPGDANHAREDTNLALSLTLDGNAEVQAAFKCGSGVEPFLGLAALLMAVGAVARRSTSRFV
ncbi:MAG: hypothetical protein JXQ73_24150 [Phycisphaerae bacterium]|nr:hypothetical protein [Phycisphaerae bacterium]